MTFRWVWFNLIAGRDRVEWRRLRSETLAMFMHYLLGPNINIDWWYILSISWLDLNLVSWLLSEQSKWCRRHSKDNPLTISYSPTTWTLWTTARVTLSLAQSHIRLPCYTHPPRGPQNSEGITHLRYQAWPNWSCDTSELALPNFCGHWCSVWHEGYDLNKLASFKIRSCHWKVAELCQKIPKVARSFQKLTKLP